MTTEAVKALRFGPDDRVLDVGCGDGYLTRAVAAKVPGGCAVGVDASPRMIETAHGGGAATDSGPWFVVADARRLPFAEFFDAVLSFNALHWVPEQRQALGQIATVLRPGGRALIQVVCAGPRTSIEATAMTVCQSPRWARWFDGFSAPYVHVVPAAYGELAASAGLTLDESPSRIASGISAPARRSSGGARWDRRRGPIGCPSRIAPSSSPTRCRPMSRLPGARVCSGSPRCGRCFTASARRIRPPAGRA